MITFQQKILLCNGGYFGLRGRDEQAYLRKHQIVVDDYEAGHPLKGIKFVSIENIQDKTKKLGVNNTVMRQGFNRIPVYDKNDMNCIGGELLLGFRLFILLSLHFFFCAGCYVRYMEKLAPGQDRLLCKRATKQQFALYRASGFPKACMNPNQPIGVNTVQKMLNEAMMRAGLGNKRGHSLRRLFCTTLANAPGVSMSECLASSRHSSVAAVVPYQKRSHSSEMAKIDALLGSKTKKVKTNYSQEDQSQG